ncbi:abortive phage infection protein [Streptomyces sp. NPDC059578]|uniref:abortive phage infection protein n=1 Tax=Streptomyces sp. NPDC059578 TaxID=3346874 RepID=UPI0036893F06
MTQPRTTHRADFLRRAAALGLLAVAGSAVTPGAATATGGRGVPGRAGRGLTYRGVVYDTGTSHGPGHLPPEVWTAALMRTDLRAIDRGLHCNAVMVCGSDLDRLELTSREALRRGLHVTLQPRLFDHPQAEILAHLARTARLAEQLRTSHQPEVVLAVGCEYILFAPGIVPGATFFDRMQHLIEGQFDYPAIVRRLNDFVREAVAVARAHFHGRITYGAAAGLEEIDWNLFDIVGVNYYAFHRDPRDHTRELAPFRRWNKPVTILEFGCCTFRGAAERGGDGWSVVDWDKPVPEVKGDLQRDEQEQAEHIANMLGVFEREGFHGAWLYGFIARDSPHSPHPRYDLDMASFSVVKVIRRDHEDPASPYHWEPKRSFYAVARHNRAARGR